MEFRKRDFIDYTEQCFCTKIKFQEKYFRWKSFAANFHINNDFLARPSIHIFNLCIAKQIYPTLWSLIKTLPVPKKDKGQDIKDNRPISQATTLAKIFESILHSDIFGQVKHRISSQQHGFCSSRSIETNLVNFTQYVLGEPDRGAQVDAAYTDFQKAFDKVDHQILLLKSRSMNFSEDAIQFFRAYLRDRYQYVS